MADTCTACHRPGYQASYPDGLAATPTRQAMWRTIREAEAAGLFIPSALTFEQAWKQALRWVLV